MEDFFFNGIWRMDWGLGNPNKTAALIVSLMIGFWALAYIRTWGFWVALAGFTALGICLDHTFSRGGFVAIFLGLIPVLWMAPRQWPWKRIGGIVAAVWIIIGFSVYFQAHERLGQGMVQEDRSISNRLELWKHAPAMMVDAPGGWGLGQSGKAFMEWYQPLDRQESYRTMVNSHLTWLVEFGWPGRFLYLAGWLTVFVICLPTSRSRWLAIPFGIWLAFFVSAIFSSVAEEPWVWVAPGLALLSSVAWRMKTSVWPPRSAWVWPPAAAALILLLVPVLWQGTEVQRIRSAVVIGQGPPSLWVVSDEAVLGSGPGRPLRMHWEALGRACVGLVDDVKDLTGVKDDAPVILTGKFSSAPSAADRKKLATAASILLVNPRVYPQDLGDLSEISPKLTVAIGEFDQSSASLVWAAHFPTRRIAGVGDFIPDWPSKLLHEITPGP